MSPSVRHFRPEDSAVSGTQGVTNKSERDAAKMISGLVSASRVYYSSDQETSGRQINGTRPIVTESSEMTSGVCVMQLLY